MREARLIWDGNTTTPSTPPPVVAVSVVQSEAQIGEAVQVGSQTPQRANLDAGKPEGEGRSDPIAPHRCWGPKSECPAGQQLDDARLKSAFDSFDSGTMPAGLSLRQYTYAASHYSMALALKEDDGPAKRDEKGKEKWYDTDTWWTFLRLMRHHPDLVKIAGGAEAVAEIPWECSIWYENDQMQIEEKWGQVTSSPWRDPVDVALRLALDNPITPARCVGGKFQPYQDTASLWAWLQRLAGDRHIYLADKKAAEKLGIDRKSAANHRRMLVREGYMRQTKPPVPNRRPARYRFDLTKFPELQGKGEL